YKRTLPVYDSYEDSRTALQHLRDFNRHDPDDGRRAMTLLADSANLLEFADIDRATGEDLLDALGAAQGRVADYYSYTDVDDARGFQALMLMVSSRMPVVGDFEIRDVPAHE